MNPKPDSLGPLDARIVTVLREVLPDVEAIYRYGSFGGTHQRPDSDLDLAVLGQQNLDAATRLQLSDLLAAQTGCVIDLNDMRSLPVTLRVQIESNFMRHIPVEGVKDPAAFSRQMLKEALP